MTRTCCDCSAAISNQSKGRCKPCSARHLNADPAISARRRAGMAAYSARPDVKAAKAARLAEYSRTPEARARAVAHGHRRAAHLQTPEMRARSNSPEAKAKAGRGRSATVLAGIPPEYWDRYRRLKASQRMSAADARVMILDEVAADRRRAAAECPQPTPFEKQMAAVAAGAKLVPAWKKPSQPIDITLGGVATGQL